MRYLDFDGLLAACRALADAHPDHVRLTTIGTSREGRPIPLLTVGDHAGQGEDGVASHPAVWVDGGTHAAEWTGVWAALHAAERWVGALAGGDARARSWLTRHTACIAPCISPDGFDATVRGEPPMRSTLRPPRDTRPRVGLDARDIDGDGRVRWMRWRHPSGPWAFDDVDSAKLRPRTVDDDPADAWHVAPEGVLLAWDGVRLVQADLRHGLDLNRNFPGAWAPFGMFGQDGGDYPLSEPESRAVVEAVRARPRIAAAVTNHTYTGALLTQPYRQPSPLAEADILLMERLGRDAVRGTGYRVLRTFPDFTYDPGKPIVGVWADTLSTTFGLPGYTLELWDPFAFAGVENPDPGGFWTRPDVARCAALVDHFAGEPGAVAPWRRVTHPQLGEVEVGGLELVRTMHNPPERLLAAECARGATVADRLLRALPDLRGRVESTDLGGGVRSVRLVLENAGMLSTSGLAYARGIGLAPPVVATIEGAAVVEGEATRSLGWLDGWGAAQVGAARQPLYPALPGEGGAAGGPASGTAVDARWLVRGDGPVTVRWDAGRGGCGHARG